MKVCNKCGVEKDFSEFYKNKKAKDGLQAHCKECRKQYQKQYYKENREKRLEYYKENREKRLEYQNQRYKENRDKLCEYGKKYRAKAQPCVYRIKHKVSGHYYLGQTTQPFCERVSKHFRLDSNVRSPLTGLNKEEWNCEVLCYGTKQEVKHFEKVLLDIRVGIDPLCLNKNK